MIVGVQWPWFTDRSYIKFNPSVTSLFLFSSIVTPKIGLRKGEKKEKERADSR
jgi:hypothetical protein